MENGIVNSKEYWDNRFNTDWEKNLGREQTKFFAKLLVLSLPEKLISIIKRKSFSILDWGCAEGDAINIFSDKFLSNDVSGLDFSEAAIARAKKNYPNNNYYAGSLNDIDKKFDVIITSNCLEHFEKPFDIVHELVKYTKECLIIMVPFREADMIAEHFVTFDYSNFPLFLDGFTLLSARLVDTSSEDSSFWSGKQFLLAYVNVNSTVISELDITLDDFLLSSGYIEESDRFKIQEKNISELNIEKDYLEKNIFEHKKIIRMLQNDIRFVTLSKFWKLRHYYIKATSGFNLSMFLRKYIRMFAKFVYLQFPIDIRVKLWNYYNKIKYKFGKERKNYHALQEIITKNVEKKIIVFPPLLEWHIPLFQRPQQIATEFAKKGYLYFFCTTNDRYEKVAGFEKIQENLYLTDQFDLLQKLLPKHIVNVYANDINQKYEFLENEINKGNNVIYEYIDEMHEDLVGKIPAHAIYKHKKILSDERFSVVVTAKKLYSEVAKFRKNNFSLVSNGVDCEHFRKIFSIDSIPDILKVIVSKNKPIIGYFGAFASWFDYELIKKIAIERPEYEIVLIGLNYDKTLNNHNFKEYENVTFLDPVQYSELPSYAFWFSVSIIPFLINDITESTSPVKLFEYMALGKPIVTTPMSECKRYKSVLIGYDHENFLLRLDEAVRLRENVDYLNLLAKDADENSWSNKVNEIIKLLDGENKN
jgi:teichuronic acid biosynthesis glycosyltransferase TuaH